jgi:chromate reductase
MPVPRILAFSGSLRRDSFNHAVMLVAAAAARTAGAEVTVIRLADHPMPLFSEDLEKEGQPAGAASFQKQLSEHHAVLIGSPEYNSSYSGALKNAIDWASRSGPGLKPGAALAGKVAGVVAASPGPLGGIRALPMVRLLLSNLGMLVVPEQVAVGAVHTHLGADGQITDPKLRAQVEAVGIAVAKTTAQRLAG